ncbi:hypothetical protein CDL15_Pgr023447 [Punica granatum]|uniref:Protein kinase domain-containing protein n=1 Tax=Punica granatum TaxID=22663 RepID=A0A218WX42_PUNGR|nr:hypothetical protein CDL15_Pgr023447 [Punica granatum]
MNLRIKSRHFCFISTIFAALLADQALSLDAKYEACAPLTCGSGPIISYPFWISSSSCATQTSRLPCSGQNPVLNFSSYNFIIKDIFYTNRSLLLVDSSAYYDQDSCNALLHSISLDRILFSFSSGKNRPVEQKVAIGVGAGVGTAIILAVAAVIILHSCKKLRSSFFKGHTSDRDIENFIKKHGSLTLKRFSYTQVKRMTCSFREKLGEGGFGAVYKGKLPDGTLVAVKLLNASKGNGEEFINEVASISRTSHVNIVTLVGFCIEGHKRALIYEYMSNGSLDRFISDENAMMRSPRLGWNKLYQIAVGTARGLEYLHRGCSTRILHFDIKPQNILLDDDYYAKISDFGLSKLCLKRESIVSMLVARGTIGYIAPEVFSRNFGDVSHKSDVYSYGMMLIEMIGGRKRVNGEADQSSEMYFADQVYQLIEEGYDQGFYCHLMEEDKETARKMAFVGVWCIQTDPKQRPSMRRVIEMLEGSAEALQIPPKPYFFSPRRSPIIESLSITVSL